jgi:FtsP/CotA-like multicopper oxidase with cupredoxin domain
MEYLIPARPENVPLNLHKGCVPAEGGHEVIEVDPSAGWVGLSFIGAVSLKAVTFTIDEHPMWIYEVDGHYIEPQKVDLARQYTGERYAVLLKLDQPFRDYTIRVADDGIGQVISSYATLRYKGRKPDLRESQGAIDYGGQNITPVTWLDRDHLHPYPRLDVALQSDNLFVFRIYRWDDLNYHHTLSGTGKWDEDTTAYDPLLHNPYSETARDENLVFSTKNDTWNDLVIQIGAFPDLPRDAPHTIHKHTTKMWQIGVGMGIWNYSSTEEAIQAQPEAFDFDNPNYRDTFVTDFNDRPSWILLRYHATNPGPWMLHCHIETHLAGGMGVTILDGIDAWPNVPPEYANGRNGITDEQRVDWNSWKLAAGSGNISESAVYDTSFGDPTTAIPDNDSWKGFTNKLIDFLHTWSPHLV